MDAFALGAVVGQSIVFALMVAFLGWCLGFIFRGPYRGHHTRVVITTVLGWLAFWYIMSTGPSSDDSYLGVAFSGPLALGIRIFGNPPPVEDEEESGEVE